MTISRLLLPLVLLLPLSPAWAQGYFVRPQPGRKPPRRHPRHVRHPGRHRAPAATQVQPLAPPPTAGITGGPGPGADEAQPPQQQVQLPPAPELPPMPKGAPPPTAVIGVLGIPEIMRASTAAQQVEKVIGQRREKLNEDAQKEQAIWRDLQQSLANQRATLSADQIRARERELQERITNAQRVFRDRNRIIQEAGQYGLAQIERMLIGVIRQVADSRNMNLVLHRAQVALNVNEFDITEQVTAQLNKVLPSVVLPPEGVSPVAAAQQSGTAPGAATPAAAAAAPSPAAAPPAAPAPAPTTAPAPVQAPAAASAGPRR